MKRRDFLKQSGLTAGALAGSSPGWAQTNHAVSLVVEAADPVATAAPVQWAARELAEALQAHGVTMARFDSVGKAAAGNPIVLAAGHRTASAAAILKSAGAAVPDAPECVALAEGNAGGRAVLLAGGSDARGVMYGLLDLAARVRRTGTAADAVSALRARTAVVERPANPVRSVARLFVSDVEDKPWFNDRAMWPEYFRMLAAQRFNRFNLSFGIGYDFLREVTDAYFLFLYPFLLSVPGYKVRAVGLPDAERDRNLETLRFISEQAAAHGIHFQLGVWTHGYQWANSPNANYTIEGLTADNHAAYCREALGMVLKACPAISGVTFRIHGESGVAEGNYPFWKTVFEGVTGAGRKVEIDLHSKGLDQGMLDVAVGTGAPLNVSPKYWAEHMGMPYHQADIREQEIPKPERNAQGFFALSNGSRSFTRYGYADLLREDRRYGVLHRVWPGTQRLLLWGDPVMAAGYSRAFGFCGSVGVELCEPLSFKGRRGSGIAGDRCAYADASLKPQWDWQKYAYSYGVWGRHLYDPKAAPETWRGGIDTAMAGALASASRILPIVTTAHLPSAANNTYWPEMYSNQPMVDGRKNNPYGDTPSPKIFSNASPLDPQLFSRMSDFAGELVEGKRSGKYSPVEVAQWLEDFADEAAEKLKGASRWENGLKPGAEFRRATVDVRIQIGLGRFFAAKFRSGVLYSIHERTGDRAALEEAVKAYRRAREIWAQMADGAKGVYQSDVTIGELTVLRGHWLDRLPAIDSDLADMVKKLDAAGVGSEASAQVKAAVQEVLGRPKRVGGGRHTAPARFRAGQAVALNFAPEGGKAASVHLHYRRVTQAERFQHTEMQAAGAGYSAEIPAAYSASPYPLQYYFEVRGANAAWLYPGFAADLANQPYFVIRQTT